MIAIAIVLVLGLIAGLAAGRGAIELQVALHGGEGSFLSTLWATLCWIVPAALLAYAALDVLVDHAEVTGPTIAIAVVTALLILGDVPPQRRAT
jgi:hypothetical protein